MLEWKICHLAGDVNQFGTGIAAGIMVHGIAPKVNARVEYANNTRKNPPASIPHPREQAEKAEKSGKKQGAVLDNHLTFSLTHCFS